MCSRLRWLWVCGVLSALGWCAPLWAATTDWGVIPVGQETTFSFAQYDITKNFTDQYSFSLVGNGDAAYAVTVIFDVCRHGCGNPSLSYGVYATNGGLIDDTGSVVLTAGNYVFQVKGTGMGAGNSVDYSGSMIFYTGPAAAAFVSAVPEPSDWGLFLVGLAGVVLAVRRNRGSEAAYRPVQL